MACTSRTWARRGTGLASELGDGRRGVATREGPDDPRPLAAPRDACRRDVAACAAHRTRDAIATIFRGATHVAHVPRLRRGRRLLVRVPATPRGRGFARHVIAPAAPLGQVAFARRALAVALARIGLGDLDTEPDCLDGLAILLGNRRHNGKPVDDCPLRLVALADALGMSLHPRAMQALDL